MKRWFLLLMLLGMMALSGCSMPELTLDPEDLYRLPTLPAKYTELNTQLNEILEATFPSITYTSHGNPANTFQRQRGVHMTRRAAAGKNHVHTLLLLCTIKELKMFGIKRRSLLSQPIYPSRFAGICRDTLNTKPISTSCSSKAVPP